MIIQAEISLYPLRTAHIGRIIADFAAQLRAAGLTVHTGAMSTIVKGEARLVMAAAGRAFEKAARKAEVMLVIKAGNACLDYKTNKRKENKNA